MSSVSKETQDESLTIKKLHDRTVKFPSVNASIETYPQSRVRIHLRQTAGAPDSILTISPTVTIGGTIRRVERSTIMLKRRP